MLHLIYLVCENSDAKMKTFSTSAKLVHKLAKKHGYPNHFFVSFSPTENKKGHKCSVVYSSKATQKPKRSKNHSFTILKAIWGRFHVWKMHNQCLETVSDLLSAKVLFAFFRVRKFLVPSCHQMQH